MKKIITLYCALSTIFTCPMQPEDVMPHNDAAQLSVQRVPKLSKLCEDFLVAYFDQENTSNLQILTNTPPPRNQEEAIKFIRKAEKLQKKSEGYMSLASIAQELPPEQTKLLKKHHLLQQYLNGNQQLCSKLTELLLSKMTSATLSHEYKNLYDFLITSMPQIKCILVERLKNYMAWRCPFTVLHNENIELPPDGSYIYDFDSQTVYRPANTSLTTLLKYPVLAISPKKNYIAIRDDSNTLHVLMIDTTANLKRSKTFSYKSKKPIASTFSHDGIFLMIGYEGGDIQKINIESLENIQFTYPYLAPQSDSTFKVNVTTISYSPNNKYFAAGATDSTVSVWDAKTLKEELTLFDLVYPENSQGQGASKRVNVSMFCSCSKLFAAARCSGVIIIWDTERWSKTAEFQHQNVSCLATSNDCSLMLSGSNTGNIKLWDLHSNSIVKNIVGLGQPIQHVGFDTLNDTLLFRTCNGNQYTMKIQTNLSFQQQCLLYVFNKTLKKNNKNLCQKLLQQKEFQDLPQEIKNNLSAHLDRA